MKSVTVKKRENYFVHVCQCARQVVYLINKKVGQMPPPTPLNFSTNAAIF